MQFEIEDFNIKIHRLSSSENHEDGVKRLSKYIDKLVEISNKDHIVCIKQKAPVNRGKRIFESRNYNLMLSKVPKLNYIE